jgi:hypothetical protein
LPALVEELWSSGAVDGAVDASAAQQRRVGGVHDGVDLEGRDVGPDGPNVHTGHLAPCAIVPRPGKITSL